MLRGLMVILLCGACADDKLAAAHPHGEGDLPPKFDLWTIENADSELNRFGGSLCLFPSDGRWTLSLHWRPNEVDWRQIFETSDSFPDLSSLPIEEVVLKSNYLPQPFLDSLQDLGNPLKKLEIDADSLSDRQIVRVLDAVSAEVEVLELRCPRVSPAVLRHISGSKVELVMVVCKSSRQHKRFVQELCGERGFSIILLRDLTTSGAASPSDEE